MRKRTLVGALIGCVMLAALVLGTSWNVRSVIAELLLLPGVGYLVLEAGPDAKAGHARRPAGVIGGGVSG